MKPSCMIVDVDGVIVHSKPLLREIFHLKLKGDKKYDYFNENFDKKPLEINHSLTEFVNLCHTCSDYKVLFLTARNEKIRKRTLNQLSKALKYEVESTDLFMRPENNKEKSEDFKKQVLKKLKKQYNIKLFIDDELKNCEMAKKLRIMALRVV